MTSHNIRHRKAAPFRSASGASFPTTLPETNLACELVFIYFRCPGLLAGSNLLACWLSAFPSLAPTSPRGALPLFVARVKNLVTSIHKLMIFLKLTMAPVLIGLVSLAERKWGAIVSGLLVGLPLTSGPVLFFLALEQGKSFSARTSVASLMALVALAGFASAYVRVSRTHGWIPSLLAATGTYLVISACLMKLPFLPVGWAFPIACVALLLALFGFPRQSALNLEFKISSGREIGLRMVTAAALVFLLTSLASLLGPVPSGLAAMLPVYTSILAVFNHMKSGILALAVLKGAVTGAFGSAVFFVIVASAQGRLTTGRCFVSAALAAIAVQALLFPYLKPAHA
jgi:hypothetical protein